jgi:hypothetical protein
MQADKEEEGRQAMKRKAGRRGRQEKFVGEEKCSTEVRREVTEI